MDNPAPLCEFSSEQEFEIHVIGAVRKAGWRCKKINASYRQG